MAPQLPLGNTPPSSVSMFGLGYRPGIQHRFLEQVDMGVNLGGLVRGPSAELSAELSAKRNQVHHLLNRLRLSHNAAELDLEGLMSEEEELGHSKDELQGNLVQHAKLVEEAYDRGDLNTAIGLEQAHKNLRVNLAVRLRDLGQKASDLAETMEATRKKLSDIELDTIRAKQRLHVIESRLLPVNNLNDALDACL